MRYRNIYGIGRILPDGRLNELDKDRNGYLDDLYNILQSSLAYVTDGKYTEVKKALKTLVKEPNGNNSYACDTARAYFDNLACSLNDAGIANIETGDLDNNRYLEFSFYGIDYQITLNYDITRGDYPYYCTINSKPSVNNLNNDTLESNLMKNIQMLAEHPEYKYDSTINIIKILDEMNIKYETGDSLYDVDHYAYSTSYLNFTFNGKDYQITLYSDITPIQDNRVIDDITDEDLNTISINDRTSILGYLGESLDFERDCMCLLSNGDAYGAYFYYPDAPYLIADNTLDEARRNMVRALGQLLKDKYSIKDLSASKDENKKAFQDYLLSIGALDNGRINIKKLVKALYIQWTKPIPTEQPHVIIRTRTTEENTETSYSEETQKYINEAKNHFGMSDSYTNSYLHTYLYSLYYQLCQSEEWSLDSIKKNMITICGIVSSFPELKSVVTEFFGEDYSAKINSYTESDMSILRVLSCNHPELMNPALNMLYKMDEKMKEYFEQLNDPSNKNGYTDVYYK